MPKLNSKIAIVNQISETALEEISTMDPQPDSEEVDSILDTAFEEIELILSYRYFIPRTNKILKSKEWWLKILPQVDDKMFKAELRVSRVSFNYILEMIRHDHRFSRKQLPVEHQLSITLSRLGEYGSGSSWLKKAAKFAVGEGTVQHTTRRVIQVINDLKDKWISWPDAHERTKIKEAPSDDHEAYFSRKQDYAIQVQAIVDQDKRIRNVTIGYPGSVHDSRVFANSNFGSSPSKYLQNDEWIAGDSAYTLSEYLITPFRKNNSSIHERDRIIFQKYFSRFRVKVENCFGILKEVFGSLKELRIRVNKKSGHKEACEWILCCCILYNIIRPEIDESDYNFLPEQSEDFEFEMNQSSPSSAAELKRMKLFHWVLSHELA